MTQLASYPATLNVLQGSGAVEYAQKIVCCGPVLRVKVHIHYVRCLHRLRKIGMHSGSVAGLCEAVFWALSLIAILSQANYAGVELKEPC